MLIRPEDATFYDAIVVKGTAAPAGGAPIAVIDLDQKRVDWNPTYQQAGLGSKQSYQYEYDFAIETGAVGTYVLRGPNQTVAGQVGTPLPPGFIITAAFLDVITAFTTAASGQGAVATPQSANDLVSATVVSGAPYSTTGIKATVPVGTAATSIKMTAQRNPTFIISVGAITAGKFRLYIEGYQGAVT